MPWKELFLVGAAAAAGQWAAQKWGTSIEAKAGEYKIPPTIAHAVVVGGAAMGGFALAKAIF